MVFNGYGPGSPYDIAGAVTANIGRERVLQFGIRSNSEFSIFGGRTEGVSMFHISAGVSGVGRWGRGTLTVGPGFVWGRRCENHSWRRYYTGGIAFSIQGLLTPIPTFGFGYDAFVNVNPINSGYGIAIIYAVVNNK